MDDELRDVAFRAWGPGHESPWFEYGSLEYFAALIPESDLKAWKEQIKYVPPAEVMYEDD